ncbi:hypothetical protein CFP56_037241 [Quercus suber]|uniref:Uncharacterized protein n=1 Tax=Quercus suber TaxID=58331 RepID=A0AAW0J6N3_QUESU
MILLFRFGQVLCLDIAWLLLFGIAVLREQLLQLYGKHLGLNPVLVSQSEICGSTKMLQEVQCRHSVPMLMLMIVWFIFSLP